LIVITDVFICFTYPWHNKTMWDTTFVNLASLIESERYGIVYQML